MVMNTDVWVALLIAAAWLFAALLHAYFYLPLRELKRRASRGNPVIHKLVMTSKYESAVRLCLGSLLYASALAAIIMTARHYDTFTTVVLLTLLLAGIRYFGRKNLRFMVKFAAWLAPYFARLLAYIQPAFKPIDRYAQKAPRATRIYEKEDLLQLLTRQKTAPNNRIAAGDLEAVLHALEFEHKKISKIMVPYDNIHFVTPKEPIGPILISELHKSGFSCFPVKGNGRDEVVGMLRMSELISHPEGGTVADAMDSKVFYVRDDQPVEQVFQAFIKTHQYMFMVVDTREQLVGLITMQDVLQDIIGHSIHTEFNEYDDPSAVAHS